MQNTTCVSGAGAHLMSHARLEFSLCTSAIYFFPKKVASSCICEVLHPCNDSSVSWGTAVTPETAVRTLPVLIQLWIKRDLVAPCLLKGWGGFDRGQTLAGWSRSEFDHCILQYILFIVTHVHRPNQAGGDPANAPPPRPQLFYVFQVFVLVFQLKFEIRPCWASEARQK